MLTNLSDELPHIIRIYFTMLKTVVAELLHRLWKMVKVLMSMIGSTGRSPKRKYNAGIGEELLSFTNPLKILL